MTRLLVEDVTLLRAENIVLHIRFKGGATRTLTVPLPLNASATARVIEHVSQTALTLVW